MDRFVWFILLVVSTHLVTEFTRVTGYARGPRRDVIVINDSLIQPVSVQNMLLYPGQDYGLYERPIYTSNGNENYNNNYNNNNNNNNNKNSINSNTNPNAQQTSAAILSNGDTSFPFSLRPLIDSIFDIPISTLRAVNNLVARLTGSYQKPITAGAETSLKSATSNNDIGNRAAAVEIASSSSSEEEEVQKTKKSVTTRLRNSLLPELNA